ncbi:hypothetical protein IT568_11535 [bacterium]|nr:hypothetical protein [bacterium]
MAIKKHTNQILLEFKTPELLEKLLTISGLKWLISKRLSETIVVVPIKNIVQISKNLREQGYSIEEALRKN